METRDGALFKMWARVFIAFSATGLLAGVAVFIYVMQEVAAIGRYYDRHFEAMSARDAQKAAAAMPAALVKDAASLSVPPDPKTQAEARVVNTARMACIEAFMKLSREASAVALEEAQAAGTDARRRALLAEIVHRWPLSEAARKASKLLQASP